MRTRVQDDRSNLTIEEYRDMTYTNNCSGQTLTNTVDNVTGLYRRTSDVEVKNFHQRRAKGEIFVNPFNSYTEERFYSSPGWSYTRGGTSYQCYESTGDGPLWLYKGERKVWHQPGGPNIPNLHNLAATSALAGVRKPEHASLVSLGELRETIQYLRNPLGSLTSYLRNNRKKIKRDLKREQVYRNRLTKSLRRGSSARTAQRVASKGRYGKSLKQILNSNEVRAVSDAYLGGRYGLRPLIGEVQSVMSAIDAQHKMSPPRETSRGYASDSETIIASGPEGAHYWYDFESEDVTRTQCNVSAGVLYSVDIRDTWGLSFSQVPVALWEMTFLSFMADWFQNMGQYLEAITPKAGVRTLGSWVVTRTERETERSYSYTFNPPYSSCNDAVNPSGTESVYSVNVKRQSGIKAALAYRPQGVNFELGTARIVDMFAIARNLLF